MTGKGLNILYGVLKLSPDTYHIILSSFNYDDAKCETKAKSHIVNQIYYIMLHDLKVPLFIFFSSSLYVLRIFLIKLANGLKIKLSVIFKQYFMILIC